MEIGGVEVEILMKWWEEKKCEGLSLGNDKYLDKYWTVSLDPRTVGKPLQFQLRSSRMRVDRCRAT